MSQAILLFTAPYAGVEKATAGETILIITLYSIMTLLNFLPTILGRKKNDVFVIFILNLLFTWTIIGWLYALYLSLRKSSVISASVAHLFEPSKNNLLT
ncbi:superinfection immunity protein [Hymenobacter tibetensis]|uniref:Superinfection immunity protein n=1 Tax=Hymenobacter tibetensis TaxID=497967 RepID=A0ABY4CZD2_9BACT|nr:superinfection immunity protein [Hymenobacter tibetensis]UOG75610.1 superinfection immunity protein [Hymenobacter tibetensis]